MRRELWRSVRPQGGDVLVAGRPASEGRRSGRCATCRVLAAAEDWSGVAVGAADQRATCMKLEIVRVRSTAWPSWYMEAIWTHPRVRGAQ